MARVRAIVLAAGRGTRMGGSTPKTLVPVRAHEPLLYYILRGLEVVDVSDVLVVTGFGADQVQEYVEEHWAGEKSFVFNARYASWGNFHSLRLGLDQSPGKKALVVNSDVVVAPAVLSRVLERWGDLVLAVQRRQDLDEEDMRVRLRGTKVLDISKHVKPAFSHGEFAGVSSLVPDAARLYANIATDLEWRAETSLYYEDVYRMMLDRVDARAVVVEPGEYAEVDEPRDLERADSAIKAHLETWPAPQRASEPEPV